MGTIEQKNLYLFILHNLTYQQNMMVHTKESRIVHKQMAEWWTAFLTVQQHFAGIFLFLEKNIQLNIIKFVWFQ